MEVAKRIISHKRPDVFHLHPIGDIHAGSIHCAEKKIKAKMQEIASQRNALWIGMGDYADCITSKDKRWSAYGLADWVKHDDIIDSQRAWLRDLFKPIKGKCLGLLTGNHEETIHDRHEDAIVKHLCADLGVQYLSYHCFVDLLFERQNTGSKRLYQIHAWHGGGGAATDGGKLMRLMRLVNEIYADIYLMGHLHDIVSKPPHRLKCINGKIKSVPLVATMTGSWLTAYTQPKEGQDIGISYAEKKGYVPNRIGCPVIHINPDKEIITVES